MKKVVCSLLCACAFGLFGCDSDDTSWEDVCESLNVELQTQDGFKSLTKDQQSQVEKTLVDACVKLYDKVPACKDEYFQYYKCAYVDHNSSYWDEQNLKENECREKYDGEEQEACVDKLYQACRSVTDTIEVCSEKNSDKLEEYFDSTDEPYKSLKALFDSWDLDVEDYFDDFDYE
ncbi:MAG: hypothetical protein IJU23_03200 [Proteobacteria bacterium]|nr:hypothetical protein [Pseudomonadota bacterium]